jgi:hypothetical protein
MRVICDAPGQTCNRLWTYVASVAQCIAEHKKMVIIFYDWTIEDFPNLLHAPFIFFPLWHKWYLERGNGWNNYKGLTWKVTHNKTWDKVFSFFGFKKGWDTMHDTRYLAQTKKELQYIFRPRQEIVDKAEEMITVIRKEADIIVGIHIRHGDYKDFFGGKFYYSLDDYHHIMINIQELYKDKILFMCNACSSETIRALDEEPETELDIDSVINTYLSGNLTEEQLGLAVTLMNSQDPAEDLSTYLQERK